MTSTRHGGCSRRTFLGSSLAALVAPGWFRPAGASPAGVVNVYKTASCGCCGKWADHLRANGFDVRTRDVAEPAVHRARLGIPDALGSCHTATVGGYALEGHVPAREVKRLLAQRPAAVGLSVPAMPPGSPGMEGPPPQPYDVLLVLRDGRYRVFARYSGR